MNDVIVSGKFDDPFEFDVTKLLVSGKPNCLILRVYSPWLGGINQHVSLVAQPEVRLIDGFARPDAAAGLIRLELTLENNSGAPAPVEVTTAIKAAASATTSGTPR